MSAEPLRFLVDVNVGQAVASWLQTEGYDALSVRDIDPRMDDRNVLALAVREGRVVITMDRDFGELVHHYGKGHAGVLLLRLGDAQSSEKVEAVRQIVQYHSDELVGHFCVYRGGRLRVRP